MELGLMVSLFFCYLAIVDAICFLTLRIGFN